MKRIWGYCQRQWKAAYWFCRTVPRPLLTLVGLAIVTLIPIYWIAVYQAVSKIPPEPWQLLLTPIERLSLSFLASFIFYLVLVHYKSRKDRRSVEGYFYRETRQVISLSHLVFYLMGGTLELMPEDIGHPDDSFIIEFCRTTGLHESSRCSTALIDDEPLLTSQAPSLSKMSSWLEVLCAIRSRSKASIQRMFDQIIYMDSEHVRLLNEVRDCSFFDEITIVSQFVEDVRERKINPKVIIEYRDLMKSLERYLNKRFREHLGIVNKP